MIKKKKQIVKYSKLFITNKFSPIRSGNISIRHKTNNIEGFFISPSGKKNSEIKVSDIVFVPMSGKIEKNKNPSSEWRFHLDLYKHTNCNAVVHAHSKYAVICSCLYQTIPSFHYMIAVSNSKSLKVAKYSTFGTKELSNNIIKAMHNSKSCLISNHGQIAIGNTLEDAFELAEEIELLCEYYYFCKLQKNPRIISNSDMKKVLNKIKDYKKP